MHRSNGDADVSRSFHDMGHLLRASGTSGTTLLGLLATAAMTSAGAQAWTAAYEPAADCVLQVAAGIQNETPSMTANGALIIQWREFGTHRAVGRVRAAVALSGEPNPAATGMAFDADTSSSRTFRDLTPGVYSLVSRGMVHYPRTDTVVVRPGGVDTITVPLEGWHDGYRNVHNCRPRAFRKEHESACVTDTSGTTDLLEYARDLAEAESRRTFNLPQFSPAEVRLVADERICERAALAYGGPEGPPRRVIVVRMGRLYLVYDPFEPLYAGEWDLRMIFDNRWRLVVALAG